MYTHNSEYLNIIHTLDFVPRVLHCLGIGQEVGDGDVGGVDYGELLILFLGNLFNFRERKGGRMEG